MTTFLYILLAIVILLLMVVIHEFGHYIAGKILKFKINEFSVGFGPKLFSKKKKNGEVFSLRLIPLGGYCAFEGETDTGEETAQTEVLPTVAPSDNASDDTHDDTQTTDTPAPQAAPDSLNVTPVTNSAPAPKDVRSFIEEKPWKRIIVLLAGGIFNILSAVIFSFLFILIVGYATPHVVEVYGAPDSGIAYCNLQVNDEIVKVNGKKINVMHAFEDYTSKLALGDEITVTVIRDGKEEQVRLVVQTITTETNGKTETYTGFGIKSERVYNNKSIGDAFIYCVPFTAKMAWTILGSFFSLITGKVAITTLTGPVGTVTMMANITKMNWRNIFVLLPLIAANLGIFNLLPIPALDGSKVVFTIIEWIRGKPINRKVENYIHTVGLLVLMAFVVIVDIVGMVLR